MSQENVEIVRGLQDAFFRRDSAAVFSALDPQIEFRPPPEHPDVGIYQGHEEVRRAFKTWLGAWDSIRFDAPEYVDAGERVLAAGRQWGKSRARIPKSLLKSSMCSLSATEK